MRLGIRKGIRFDAGFPFFLKNEPGAAADKNLARGNDTVFSMHLKEKMLPVTSRLERRFIR
jgi:hypothetical protein